MKVNSINLVFFSPTQTTEKIVRKIAEGYHADHVNIINLTMAQTRKTESIAPGDGLTIIGAPVYGGRIATTAVKAFNKLEGNGQPAAIIVLYGNREYEDALLELKDIAVKVGFIPIAGGAFIGEHSFATDEFPIALGRPDKDDYSKALNFGAEIRKRLESISFPDDHIELSLPGNYPYRELRIRQSISLKTKTDTCTYCGICADVCPTGAISVADTVETDINSCIACCACVKNCPENARIIDDPEMIRISQWLNENCRTRKEPEIYIV